MTVPSFLTASGKINRSAVFNWAWERGRAYAKTDSAHALRLFDARIGVAWALAREEQARIGLSARECEIRDLESEIAATEYITNYAVAKAKRAELRARLAALKTEG